MHHTGMEIDVDPTVTVPASITDSDAIKRWKYGKFVSDHLPVMLVLKTGHDTDRLN